MCSVMDKFTSTHAVEKGMNSSLLPLAMAQKSNQAETPHTKPWIRLRGNRSTIFPKNVWQFTNQKFVVSHDKPCSNEAWLYK